jgi:hypothetical protein
MYMLPISIALLVGVPSFIFDQYLLSAGSPSWDGLGVTSDVLMVVVGLPMGVFAVALGLNDLFGYVDAPVRFDRARRKVYVWASRKEGPLELDWDRIRPVAQSITAPPYQVNSFRSVLLVDEDAEGNVLFEGRIPRIAQIGAAVLNREHTLAAYEFVRVFMERGPQALPPVKEHLILRPSGLRPWVDIWGTLKGFMRDFPSRPKHERSWFWLIAGVVFIALAAPLVWPLMQLGHAIATRVNRIPRWPQRYEELAAIGGPLVVPPGSVPNDPPMLPHEKLIGGIWLGMVVLVWGWIAWKHWL